MLISNPSNTEVINQIARLYKPHVPKEESVVLVGRSVRSMSSFESVVDGELEKLGSQVSNKDRGERIVPEVARNPSGAAEAPNSSILS